MIKFLIYSSDFDDFVIHADFQYDENFNEILVICRAEFLETLTLIFQ